MLILILVFLAIISISLVILKRDKNSMLLLGLCTSLILMFSGIIIYTAKIGGVRGAQEVFLFLSPTIKNKIQYMVITLDKLGYLIAIGRFLFPAFLLILALNYSMIPYIQRSLRWAGIIFILPVTSLVLYYPQIFYNMVRGRFALQKVLMTGALIWIYIYIALAIGLLIKEYISITIPYFSHQFRYILYSHIDLALLYGIYSVQDPIQVYQLYGADYLWVSGISYANPSLSFLGWLLLSTATIIFVVLGFYNLFSYTKVNYQDDQEDIQMQRKFDTASMGVSVFVHSIKNQLLSARVLNKKINQVITMENPDLEELKRYTDRLNQLNENMLERMEELYKYTKSNSILLTPVSLESVVQTAMERVYQKYPNFKVELNIELNTYILADITPLSEALYNLLINAQDAVVAAGREAKSRLGISTHQERLYTVIAIKDNGIGIPKNKRKKIFDPFYTNKNTNYNWGMGLYFVRQIVQSHFGILRFESTPGEGTTFYIMLPRYNKQ